MRDEGIRFTTFQTKTEASSAKSSDDGEVEEVPQRFQTRAIGFDERKGENSSPGDSQADVEEKLEDARKSWIEAGDPKALRSTLLRLLMLLESAS